MRSIDFEMCDLAICIRDDCLPLLWRGFICWPIENTGVIIKPGCFVVLDFSLLRRHVVIVHSIQVGRISICMIVNDWQFLVWRSFNISVSLDLN